MSTTNIIILIVIFIIGIILIKIIAKVLFKVIIFLAVAGVICYLLFFFNGGLLNSGKKEFVLYALQARYCSEKFDSVKCECTINPLVIALKEEYSSEQIAELNKDVIGK